MTFAAPILLLGLIPWGVAAVYVLWGRSRQMGVPFLPLWRAEGATRRATTAGVRKPPIALVLLLAAAMLGVLAAARPAIPWSGVPSANVVIVVDRGVTMSAWSGGSRRPRFVVTAEALAPRVNASAVTVVDALTGDVWRGGGSNWVDRVRRMKRTALPTGVAALRAAVVGHLRGDRVFVITDRPVAFEEPNVEVVGPGGQMRDVGIVSVAARERPTPQVMLELGSRNYAGRVNVRVSSAGASVAGGADLTAGGRAAVFVDLPKVGETIEARLVDASDDVEADDVAYLAREGASPPRLEARTPLPAGLARMVNVYSKQRPAGEAGAVVAIAVGRGNVAPGEAAAVLDQGTPGAVAVSGSAEELQIVPHAVTAAVDWAGVIGHVGLTGGAVPEGFEALVKVRGRAFVAARGTPARQVWVAMDDAAFATRLDYVVFWTNMFTWLGGGDSRAEGTFVSHPVSLTPVSWKGEAAMPSDADAAAWPNVFRRPSGEAYAMNASFPTENPGTPPGHTGGEVTSASTRSLLAAFVFGALGCVLGAAVFWRHGQRS